MATAIAVLDAVRARDDVPADAMPRVFGRISFFLNAGIRFVEEVCKARAMTELWDELGRDRYGVDRPERAALPLRRAGEQPGPHRGAAREQRDPDRARGARRDALEARPLPRAPAPRLERGARPAAALGPAVVAAHPADPRLRDRPARARRPLRRLPRDRGAYRRAARRGPQRAREGAGDGRRDRRRRERLHEAAAGRVPHAARCRRSSRARSRWSASTPAPRASPRTLTAAGERAILRVDEAAEREQIERLRAFRARRSGAGVAAALRALDDGLARRRQRDAALDRAARRRASRPASGPTRCARCTASTARRPASSPG